MRQGWKRAATFAALMVCALAPLASEAAPTAKKSTRAPRVSLHQFSGVVTAINASSLTVEKSGRSPRTMQFARDAKTSTQGELSTRSEVTVYYRDEDGKPTAHRVVVRTPPAHTP